jgi:hypothetical protein
MTKKFWLLLLCFFPATIPGLSAGMVYTGSSVISTTLPVGRGTSDERVIMVNVITEGSANPLTLNMIQFNLNGTTRLASGSAHQLHDGRIVGAVGVRQNSGDTISNFMIYSDDSGVTWHYKPAVASVVGNEAKIVELDNGNLMMNIRNQTPDCRKTVISQDGGGRELMTALPEGSVSRECIVPRTRISFGYLRERSSLN